jgi:hypothetical protein
MARLTDVLEMGLVALSFSFADSVNEGLKKPRRTAELDQA